MRIKKGPYCCAPNCGNNRGGNPDLSFFTFPKNLERCRQWIINAGFTDYNVEQFSRKKPLCSEHFERSQFTSELQRALAWNAVPTIFVHKKPVPYISVKSREALLQCAPPKMQPSEGIIKIEKSSPQTDVLHTNTNTEIADTSCTPEKSVDPILLRPVTLTKDRQEIRRLIKLPASFTPGKSVKVTPILLRPATLTTDQIQRLKKLPPSFTPGKSVDTIVLQPVALTKDQQKTKRLKILPFLSSTPGISRDPNVPPVTLIKHEQEIEVLQILPPSCTPGKSGDPNLPEPVTNSRNQQVIRGLKKLPSSGTLGKPDALTLPRPATATEGQLKIKSMETLTSFSIPSSSADQTQRQKELEEIRRLRKLLHSRQSQLLMVQKKNKQLRTEIRENTAQLLKDSRRSRKKALNEDVEIVTKIASKYLTEQQVNFFAMQIRMSSVLPEGRRWTEDDKRLGKSILDRGREGYEHFAKYFDLPSVRTIQNFKLSKQQ